MLFNAFLRKCRESDGPFEGSNRLWFTGRMDGRIVSTKTLRIERELSLAAIDGCSFCPSARKLYKSLHYQYSSEKVFQIQEVSRRCCHVSTSGVPPEAAVVAVDGRACLCPLKPQLSRRSTNKSFIGDTCFHKLTGEA